MHPHANVALGDGSVGQNNPLWEDQKFAWDGQDKNENGPGQGL